MRILAALIAVCMLSGAVAQKKPAGFHSGSDAPCDPVYAGNATTWSCKDPKTSKTQKVQCKKPPKQKIPDKVTLAELDEACSLRSDNRF